MLRIVVIGGLLGAGACSGSGATPPAPGTVDKPNPKVVVLTRTKALAGYPCQQCHQHAEGEQGTVVNSHAEIRLNHMPGATCSTCHAPEVPGKLRLASGAIVDLEKNHELCAQCHSPQVADWLVGIHGKQIGNWKTEIHRYACTTCHSAHTPRFGLMDALPAPPSPLFRIPKGEH